MTSRELRNRRREAERKARKLSYQQSRAAAASSQEICGAGRLVGEPVARPASSEPSSSALAANPDLFDEFSAEEQLEMMAIRARVHARAGIPDPAEAPAAVVRKSRATGPTTPEGKATSSGNSLKHGLASGRIIVPGEDPAHFEALLQDLIAEHAPATTTEQLLVQQMAQSWWLTQRAIRLQNEAFTETGVDAHKLALFLRYQTTYERAFYKALNTLTKLKLNRDREGAVSSHRQSAPDFVSQALPQSPGEIGFVSQNAQAARLSPLVGQALSPAEATHASPVSQNSLLEASGLTPEEPAQTPEPGSPA